MVTCNGHSLSSVALQRVDRGVLIDLSGLIIILFKV